MTTDPPSLNRASDKIPSVQTSHHGSDDVTTTDRSRANETLSPCPFCGGKPHPTGENTAYVCCLSCGAEGPVFDEEDDARGSAIAAWNHRVVSGRAPAPLPPIPHDQVQAIADPIGRAIGVVLLHSGLFDDLRAKEAIPIIDACARAARAALAPVAPA